MSMTQENESASSETPVVKSASAVCRKATRSVVNAGTSITHEERLNFKIAMFPMLMQLVYNCEHLLQGDVSGKWWHFQDGAYSAAINDCNTLLLFAKRILGYRVPNHVETDGENSRNICSVLTGRDAKQILKDFSEYVSEADRNEREAKSAAYVLREEISSRGACIRKLENENKYLRQLKDNPLSAASAYQAFLTMWKNLSAVYSDMENSVAMTKNHAEKQAILEWTKAIRKEADRACAKCEKYRNHLERQGVFEKDADGNLVVSHAAHGSEETNAKEVSA